MVQAIINISDKTNRVLNIIKATHSLKTKSEAIDMLAQEYEAMSDPRPLKKEFVEEMKRIEKTKPIPIGTIDDFRKKFGIKDVQTGDQ